MSRHRRSTREKQRPASPAPAPAGLTSSRVVSVGLEIDLLAIVILLLVAMLAWASRGNLNVDGAAYLDLADHLRHGDWSGFVQGYWSPAYPALMALAMLLTGSTGADAAILAHGVNFLVALIAVLLLWRLARQRGDAPFARLAFAAFLLCSARTPRLDAVTPDLMLIVVLIGLAAEVLRERGSRPLPIGLWLGAAFLVKTSTWPWLLVALPVLVGMRWRLAGGGRSLLIATAAVAVLAGGWITAMSLDAGRPSIGGTGRLNACWYLEQCDGRTPDTHRGEHSNYRLFDLGGQHLGRIADFDGDWTYAPWSDPGAWQAGVTRQERVAPSVSGLLRYWITELGLVLGLWSSHLLLAVVVPLLFVTRPTVAWREIFRRPAGQLIFLGLIGIVPFIAVHAEPRLIAPYLLLGSLGWLCWRLDGTRRRGFTVVTWLGLVTALPRGILHVRDQQLVTESTTARMSRLLPDHPPAGAPFRVAVIGPALPLMPDLYRARAEVAVQLFVPTAEAVTNWPPELQRALQAELRRAGATEAWLSRGKAGYSVVLLDR